MSARSLFARALAAAAAVGIAVAAPATVAGAATNPQPRPAIVAIAPLGVTVNLGSTPVVTIGGTGTPGVTATVPADGHVTATVGQPALPAAAIPVVAAAAPVLAPAAPVLGAVVPSSGRIVDADVAVHACVAIALLEGRAPTGCALPAGRATPALADALAQVGICARAAVLAAGPLTPCGAPATGPTGTAAVPPSLVGIDGDAQVCAAATVLGLADPAQCPAGTGGGSDGTVTGPTAGDGGSGGSGTTGGTDGTSVDGDVDVCLGLAVLTATDTGRCTDPAANVSGTDGPAVGGIEGDGVTPALLAATSGSGDDPGATGDAGGLAFTGADTMLLTLAGLGSVASGLALRRSARARRVA